MRGRANTNPEVISRSIVSFIVRVQVAMLESIVVLVDGFVAPKGTVSLLSISICEAITLLSTGDERITSAPRLCKLAHTGVITVKPASKCGVVSLAAGGSALAGFIERKVGVRGLVRRAWPTLASWNPLDD